MDDFVAAAKRFHRKVISPRPNRVVDCPPAPPQTADPDLIPVGDASAPFTKSDKEQAKERLKEETKGQTLGEWYEKEKKKPAPTDDAKEPKIEAYGVKGMSSTKWRKEFASHEELEKWADKNDAEIQGVRKLEESQ